MKKLEKLKQDYAYAQSIKKQKLAKSKNGLLKLKEINTARSLVIPIAIIKSQITGVIAILKMLAKQMLLLQKNKQSKKQKQNARRN